MGTEPEDLRRDIARRREDLGETIDAIGDRVSPGRMMERRRNRMTNTVQSFRERVMGSVGHGTEIVGDAAGSMAGSVREHVGPSAMRQQTTGSPLGAGVVAFGIGFLVAAAIPPSEREKEAAQKAQGALEPALEPAKQALTEAAQNVAQDVKEGATQAAQEVKQSATEAAGSVAETAKDEAAAAKDDAQQLNPSA